MASRVAHLARVAGRAVAAGASAGVGSAPALPAAAAAAARAAPRFAAPARGFAAGGPSVTYEGVTIQKPGGYQYASASFFATLFWFWVFYRMKYDGDAVLWSGHGAHFEHEEHEKDHKH